MSLTCEMLQDLMPLYRDGLASPDSARAVREHLRTCKNCRDLYRRAAVSDLRRAMRARTRQPATAVGTEDEIALRYRTLSRRLQRRYLLRTVVTASVIAASVTLAAASVLKNDSKGA